MPCYLVRLIDNREAVGLFSADSVDELFMLIDEVTDPGACECAEIPNGGLTWPASGAMAIPVSLGANDDDDADEAIPNVPTGIGGVSVTESWQATVFDDDLEFVALMDLSDE